MVTSYRDVYRNKVMFEDAVREAETKTRADIVVVTSPASDTYVLWPFVWGGFLALFVPLPLVYMTHIAVDMIYALQLAAFLFISIFFQYFGFRRFLVPKAVRNRRVKRAAHTAFLDQRLHTTPERLGVLVYISFEERRIEVVDDIGVAAKVTDVYWQDLISDLGRGLAVGDGTAAIKRAIERAGDVLSEHFPVLERDTGGHLDDAPIAKNYQSDKDGM